MINFSNEGILIALTYFIPGYMINTIISRELSLDNDESFKLVYRFILFSFINLFIITVIDYIFYLIFRSSIVSNIVFVLFLRNFVSPLILGFIIITVSKSKMIVKLKQLKQLRYLVEAAGFDSISLTNSAWDYAFKKLEANKEIGSYVIIELTNGKLIFGLYGVNSFVTNRNRIGTNSIFLSDTFNDFNDFESNGSSVIIQEAHIYTISFDKKVFEKECLEDES